MPLPFLQTRDGGRRVLHLCTLDTHIPRIYRGLNLSSLNIAIAPLKPMPSPFAQTRDGGVFDTICPRFISTVDTPLPVLTTPSLGIAIVEGILRASHTFVIICSKR